jgi:hypothetical protein
MISGRGENYMKAINEKDKTIPDLPNNEEKIELNLSVSDFDMSSVEIGDMEEIDAKLIGYIEKEVRNSFEYRGYIQYLKEELDLTKCALLPNIDTKITPVSLEFHHFPFTLYDITEVITKSMVHKAKNKTVSCFDVAETVVLEHFRNNIGLVPLTETLHQMAHNNAIIIPINKVNGNYKEFIKRYHPFIESDKVERIIMMESYNGSEDAKKYNNNKLKKRIVNYNIDYNRENNQEEEDADV